MSFAIDGKDETAWGIDAGPGRRNVPRVAVFIPEKPIELPDGGTLHFNLKQMHGGWNSDDNQNHNLGRFRMSARFDSRPVESEMFVVEPDRLAGTVVADLTAMLRAQRSSGEIDRKDADAI